MQLEIMLIVETEALISSQELLSEIVSNLESVDVTVLSGCVLLDGEQVAIYDIKEQK